VCINGVLFHKDKEFVRNSIAMALCVFVCVRERLPVLKRTRRGLLQNQGRGSRTGSLVCMSACVTFVSCVYTYVCMCTYTIMHTCIHTYNHTYIHTHTHTHIHEVHHHIGNARCIENIYIASHGENKFCAAPRSIRPYREDTFYIEQQ
jgi:hypothetical protein